MTQDRYLQILNDISEDMNYAHHTKAEYRECLKRLMLAESDWISRYEAVRMDLMDVAISATKAFHVDHPCSGEAVKEKL